MAEPVIIAISPANTWVKVSGDNGINHGQFDVTKSGPYAYLRAYVDFGEPAPVDDTKALRFYRNFEFSNTVLSDVYIKAIDGVGEILASI